MKLAVIGGGSTYTPELVDGIAMLIHNDLSGTLHRRAASVVVRGFWDKWAEALARIEIPQDILDRISDLIIPGSSLIISDQGLGGETGEGTDFIVTMR